MHIAYQSISRSQSTRLMKSTVWSNRCRPCAEFNSNKWIKNFVARDENVFRFNDILMEIYDCVVRFCCAINYENKRISRSCHAQHLIINNIIIWTWIYVCFFVCDLQTFFFFRKCIAVFAVLCAEILAAVVHIGRPTMNLHFQCQWHCKLVAIAP